ncbi:hypothetical protein SAMN05421820_101285 [Pedobacter steynii]|uniref:SH3 domain-containing protein n=1 Tax=Pedobacter steynii TaxID=430522 RepID=A0A1G9JJI2_9SPHI|nr:hypothetical protein [Pedobacter steynii]NQX38271.1 hypothetical protein [Pedobacter steynii]SDL37648.1 hypothetical protein SAMN05421820_101285 [Pedobacter steynii]
MFKQVFTALLIILSVSVRAQERPAAYAVDENFNLWNKKTNDTTCVFADIAYIRDYPGLKGMILDSLTTGTRVIIKSEAYNNTLIKDFHAPWHKVTYMAGKQQRSGFIWLGLLALGTNHDKEGKLWMYGFNKYLNRSNDEEHLSLCEIKVLDPSLQTIGRTSILVTKGEQTFTEGKILDNMGLAGLQAIYRIGFFGEACAVPTDHHYIGWTGLNFIRLPGKSNVSDAGVLYHQEKLLFPAEHRLDPSLIIKDIIDGEVIDPDQKELKYKESKKRVKYIWDGKIASEIIEMK